LSIIFILEILKMVSYAISHAEVVSYMCHPSIPERVKRDPAKVLLVLEAVSPIKSAVDFGFLQVSIPLNEITNDRPRATLWAFEVLRLGRYPTIDTLRGESANIWGIPGDRDWILGVALRMIRDRIVFCQERLYK
jgi:hypothetical protein